MTLPQLYDYAAERGIDVDWYTMPEGRSFSVFLTAFDRCAIALDPWKFYDIAEEYTALGHEIGHCETGSFYNRWAACDIRRKHENRADKWAVEKLVPRDELDAAVAAGYTELWQLAEYFHVTEDFMRKAMCWYTHGNMAVEQYMLA